MTVTTALEVIHPFTLPQGNRNLVKSSEKGNPAALYQLLFVNYKPKAIQENIYLSYFSQ